MRKFILSAILLLVLSGTACPESEQNAAADPNKLFYSANALYEKREYTKALDEYRKIPDVGVDSAHLYYNMANSCFKLGKLGYAILYYEKAKRIMPQDSDLKQNLEYARSLVSGPSYQVPQKKFVISLIKAPFKEFNLNTLTIVMLAAYLLLFLFQTFSVLNPIVAKKVRILHVMAVIIFLMSLGAFAIRYYDEEFLRRGVVVAKNAECRYEPIDKSTVFYKLQEGDDVLISKTRDGWTQIKRGDGKIGWVNADAVGEI